MWFSTKRVFHAACGLRHTLVLVGSGKGAAVYAFGSSKKGQLGIGLAGEGAFVSKGFSKANHTCHPSILETLNGCRITSVHANGDHSAALSDGDLYVWGRGFGNTSNILLPYKIPNEFRFCQVALGWNHLLALTYDGQVYATGSNWYGALNSVKTPISKEHHGAQSMDALKEESHSSSQVSEVTINQFVPLKGCAVRWVAAGSEHSAAILSDGSVVSWGWGEHGQLGLGTTNDQSCPKIVADVPKTLNSQVYCGCGFTFFCKTC